MQPAPSSHPALLRCRLCLDFSFTAPGQEGIPKPDVADAQEHASDGADHLWQQWPVGERYPGEEQEPSYACGSPGAQNGDVEK